MAIRSRQNFAKLFGKRVREIRESRKISLKHFEALENSFSRNALSDIETGKKVPNLYTVYRISIVLKVPIEKLLNGLI